MSIEDIKSPLPPRRVDNSIESTPSPDTQDVFTRQPSPQPETPPSPPSPPPGNRFTPQKMDLSKFLLPAGIVVGIIVILFIVVKLLLPKLQGGTEATKININYWGLWEDSSIISSVIADYEAKNPNIKINYKKNQKTDYRSRLEGRLAKSGAEEDVPDIFRIHASWLPMFADNLAPVPSTTVKNLEMDTDFYNVFKEDLKLNEQYMGVPLMYDGLALFYNKDLVESAQIELPKSWWDLETAASKMTVRDENGHIKVAGAAMGMVDNVDHWSDIVGLMMKQNGVDPLLDTDSNNQKIQDVLTFYTLFRSKDKVWDESLPSSTEFFASGKLAFYFAPSWRVFNIQEMNPDLKFEITTVPQLPTMDTAPSNEPNASVDMTNIHWSTYWFEGVNSKSKNQKEAWKFLEFLASRENLEKMYTAASNVRSFGEIYPRKSMADKIASKADIKPFLTSADYASTWYLSSRTFDAGLNDDMSKYFGDAINSILSGKKEPTVAVKDLKTGINQLKQKYQLKK